MRLSLPLVVLLVLTAALIPAALPAATITVNSTADNPTAGDGQCTLREAVANVNASGDTTGGDCTAGSGTGDTIDFALTLPAKIRLTMGELGIDRSVAITGPTTGTLVVSGAGSTVIGNDATTSLSDLTIRNGRTIGSGGAIFNVSFGHMTITDCTFTRNKAQGGASGNTSGGGGAIYNVGTMTITGCTFIANKTGTVPNPFNQSADGQAGGAIHNAFGGTLTITNSTFAKNKAIDGGAIHNAGGTMTVVNSTINGNRASSGAGISNFTPFYPNGTVTVLNTIVANESAGGNCAHTITSNGHNLDSDGTCFASGGTDLVNVDPLLARLANYGGPTATIALCTGVGAPSARCDGASPAIDAGDDAVLDPPYNLTTDQRGLSRKAGLHVDIGAYEVQ
jgi:CSLREA domain-containing protein